MIGAVRIKQIVRNGFTISWEGRVRVVSILQFSSEFVYMYIKYITYELVYMQIYIYMFNAPRLTKLE